MCEKNKWYISKWTELIQLQLQIKKYALYITLITAIDGRTLILFEEKYFNQGIIDLQQFRQIVWLFIPD